MKSIRHGCATLALIVAGLALNPGVVNAACPGCCSSHGGISSVCASNGRIYCVDGTVSPTCLCSTCGVSPTPTPSCTGGRTLVGGVCVCPGGSQWAAIEGTCHTPAAAVTCPSTRGAVRLGTDSTVGEVDSMLIPTSVEDLRAYEPITDPSGTTRVGTLERSTFILDGALASYQLTNESDYLLTLRGSTGQSLQVRIPHPTCVGSASPFSAAVATARSAIDNAFATTTTTKFAATPIRVTGIGYYPSAASGTSIATAVEIGPVTAVTLNPSGTLPPVPDVTVVEYYSISTDSYFLTGRSREKALLDTLPAAFRRTGMTLVTKAAAGTPTAATAICRYFFKEGSVNSTHFYGAGADCPTLKATARVNTAFNDEGFDFLVGGVISSSNRACGAAAPFTVSRSFRPSGSGKTVNHRYTVSLSTYAATQAKGYTGEGPTYCVLSATDVTP